jgi:hypothetical protein
MRFGPKSMCGVPSANLRHYTAKGKAVKGAGRGPFKVGDKALMNQKYWNVGILE